MTWSQTISLNEAGIESKVTFQVFLIVYKSMGNAILTYSGDNANENNKEKENIDIADCDYMLRSEFYF
jgi:hypothetical protein